MIAITATVCDRNHGERARGRGAHVLCRAGDCRPRFCLCLTPNVTNSARANSSFVLDDGVDQHLAIALLYARLRCARGDTKVCWSLPATCAIIASASVTPLEPRRFADRRCEANIEMSNHRFASACQSVWLSWEVLRERAMGLEISTIKRD